MKKPSGLPDCVGSRQVAYLLLRVWVHQPCPGVHSTGKNVCHHCGRISYVNGFCDSTMA